MIKGVPYDAEVEYLQSTGTQYIDTGVGMSGNLYFSLSIEPTYSTGDRKYMGVYSSSYGVCQLNGYWRLMATGWYLSNIPVSTDSFTLIERKSDGWYIGGTNVRSPWGEGPSDNNLVVFAFKEESGTVNTTTSLCKIARLKLYTGTTLVRDYIPVRVGQVGYLYDRVSGKLFGNAGTGAFTLGPDVATPVMSLHRMASPTAMSYVRNGLVAMWDAIENAGWGQHNASATTWKNLVTGDASQDLDTGFEWGTNFLWAKNGTRSSTALYPDGVFSTFNPNSQYTMELVYKDYISGGEIRQLFMAAADNTVGFMTYMRTGYEQWDIKFGKKSYYIYNNNSSAVAGSHVLVLTYDGTTTKVYIDGVYVAPSAGGGSGSTLVPSNSSAYFAWVNPSTHHEKYCRLSGYSRALTAAEIAYNYNIDRLRFGIGGAS